MCTAHLGLLNLMAVPATGAPRLVREKRLTALDPWQVLSEMRLMVEGPALTGCLFRANHASNYLPLKASLPRDREKLLEELDRILAARAPGSLKEEFIRGF